MKDTNSLYETNVFRSALSSGNLPLAPGKDGMADTRPVKNPLSGKTYTGMEAFMLKCQMKARGLEESGFVSMAGLKDSLKTLRSEGLILEKPLLKKGASWSLATSVVEKRDAAGKITRSTHSRRVINLGETRYAEEIKAYSQRLGEKRGVSRTPGPVPGKKTTLTCVSTDPAAVLGLYIAALETGRPFTITAVQYKSWSEKTSAWLNRPVPAQSLSGRHGTPAASRPPQGRPAAGTRSAHSNGVPGSIGRGAHPQKLSPGRQGSAVNFTALAVAAVKAAAAIAITMAAPTPALAAIGIAGITGAASAVKKEASRGR
jgi:hypothetical protein